MESSDRSNGLRRSPLHSRHDGLGARFTVFAGWEMPLQYSRGTVAECRAVRERAGVFDVSHLARVWLTGPGAGPALRSVTSYNVSALEPGEAHYSLYCNDQGGIEDDVFVYRLSGDRWLIVHNAANAEADLARLRSAGGPEPADETAGSTMLAVQGPAALTVLGRLFDKDLSAARRNECLELAWDGADVVFARTGYTGEDGGECITAPEAGGRLLEALVTAGVEPAGLAARDVLRLEAALPLHGNDISAQTHPYEAGLAFAVSLEDADFTGRQALTKLAAAPPGRRLTCLQTGGRAVLRSGYPVSATGTDGEVAALTSGAFSPTLGLGIGMAYLPAALSSPGTELLVRVRSTDVPTRVVKRPFYRRSR